jgi:hypothetical protein
MRRRRQLRVNVAASGKENRLWLVVSAGPDGEFDTEDDVTSRRARQTGG